MKTPIVFGKYRLYLGDEMDQILNFCRFLVAPEAAIMAQTSRMFAWIGPKNKHAYFDKDRSVFSGSNGP